MVDTTRVGDKSLEVTDWYFSKKEIEPRDRHQSLSSGST